MCQNRIQPFFYKKYFGNFAFNFFFLTFFAIIATFVVANSITKHIKELKDVADKVSMGELQQNITVTGNDEISELGQSFQRTINAFKMSQAMNKEEAGRKV